MVTMSMRWPWPPTVLRKFSVNLVVRAIEGVVIDSSATKRSDGAGVLMAEVRWKGPRMTGLSSLRRKVRRNCTKEEEIKGENGVVVWNEDFESMVGLTVQRDSVIDPWEIQFLVFYVSKNKKSIIGMTSLNLAEYVSTSGDKIELNLPLLMTSALLISSPIIQVTIKLLELKSCTDSFENAPRHMIPLELSYEKNELSALKAGLRKVKRLTEYVSTRKSKNSVREDGGSDGRYSSGSQDADYTSQFDTDSFDDEELQDGKDDASIRDSFSYGTLAMTTYVYDAIYCDLSFNGEYEDCVYYNHRRSDADYFCSETMNESSVVDKYISLASKKSILPWRKRKYSLRSPKNKGEPLLKKAYGEEGGDDIDYDRRQLISSDESFYGIGNKTDDDPSAHHSSISDFGDDNFAVGSWELKKFESRDGKMTLFTNIFFASIDQRSERAAGQSACTALVATIADWFNSNPNMMPIKSQFDTLIREGSSEWRNLCENQMYRELFPDKHFDLETVIQAKIRPLSIVPTKSFVGFFHPTGSKDVSGFDFLHGAMSFDEIWDEISYAKSDCIYIVSWNDHFFLLKVELDAYYIIDTLGERLFEGCDQAYILKFDKTTAIHRALNKKCYKIESDDSCKKAIDADKELICQGKDSCKEYIKSFLAAIPIRELHIDIKKGFMASTPLHHRLQIEFHYAEMVKEPSLAF